MLDGFNETRSVLTNIASKNLYEPKDPRFSRLTEKVWLHSLACALTAGSIARKLAFADEAKYFQMGLLHDIGKPPLLKLVSATDMAEGLLDMEEIVESIDEVHTAFGGTLLQRWGFPGDFVRIATRHEGLSFAPQTEQSILVVNLANHIAHNAGYGWRESAERTDPSTLDSARLLQLDLATIEAITVETAHAMEGTSPIF